MRIYKNTSKRYDEISAYNYGKILRSTYVDRLVRSTIEQAFDFPSYSYLCGIICGIEYGRDALVRDVTRNRTGQERFKREK